MSWQRLRNFQEPDQVHTAGKRDRGRPGYSKDSMVKGTRIRWGGAGWGEKKSCSDAWGSKAPPPPQWQSPRGLLIYTHLGKGRVSKGAVLCAIDTQSPECVLQPSWPQQKWWSGLFLGHKAKRNQISNSILIHSLRNWADYFLSPRKNRAGIKVSGDRPTIFRRSSQLSYICIVFIIIRLWDDLVNICLSEDPTAAVSLLLALLYIVL